MKTILIYMLILSSTFTNYTGCSFAVENGETAVQLADIVLNGFSLDSEKKKIISKFGRPDSLKRLLNEFDNTFFEIYFYGGSELHFAEGKLTGFTVADSTFFLSKLNISIGDSVDKLNEKFPKSFIEKESGNSEELVRVLIDGTDSYLIFTCKDGVIIRYEKWDSQ